VRADKGRVGLLGPLALLSAIRAFGPCPAQDGAVANAAVAEREVTLDELALAPGRHLGEAVRFALQFHSPVEQWDPLISRFGPEDWLGFEAWPDERFTWEADVFAHPSTRLFVRRTGALAPLVRRAHMHARWAVHAVVREAFLGEPWIEVVALEPLEGEVGQGTLLHLERARQLVAERAWTLALEQYERAKAAPLPPHALAAIEKEILEVRDRRANDPEAERKDAQAERKEAAERKDEKKD